MYIKKILEINICVCIYNFIIYVLYIFCVVKFWKIYVRWEEKCMFLNYIFYDCYYVYNKFYVLNFYGFENIINFIFLMLLFMKYLVGVSFLICY